MDGEAGSRQARAGRTLQGMARSRHSRYVSDAPDWAIALDPAACLSPTALVDSDHPDVAETAARITSGARDDVERAVRLHDFVRDEILFGWAPEFDRYRASEVLRDRIGFCNTKSTLLAALLRASGVPARIHCATIHRKILDGLIRPPQPYVDHAYVEAWLEDRWLGFDSYNLDRPLHAAAMARCRAEGRAAGYGVHARGTASWDGRSPAFSQFLDDGSVPDLSDEDFGCYVDLDAFKATGRGRNVANLPARLAIRFLTRSANRRVSALRGGG